MHQNDIKQSQSYDLVKTISMEKEKPTRIMVNGILIDYWRGKSSKTGPIIIFRQEISD